ncbi:prepilin-type N-terminal cleavage/methylation domain-containing protein [Diaminobutyricimonas sp. TR449]|uniref:prepilin-type N-terminal cleavage/methylation domain-containing protein n=1 Tax=Diaminobutyricimonas sp. TR449 TaxID=2708076 RepID=UPI00141E1906|nr:prepilin-type N-terminal cleavage/methylation domain-containing protein [Diaminobutyricimonas sp. TR449]
MNENTPPAPDPKEAGFGLIEIMVSMFLLALLAVAFLPLLVESMRSSVVNATAATASQIASAQLDEARALQPYCDVLSGMPTTPAAVIDARGTSYQAIRTIGVCPGSYPGVIQISVAVTPSTEVAPIVTSTTRVYVEAATAPTP